MSLGNCQDARAHASIFDNFLFHKKLSVQHLSSLAKTCYHEFSLPKPLTLASKLR